MAKMTGAVRAYLAAIGAKGGQARAENHPPERLRAWAGKGGRPQSLGADALKHLAAMRRGGATLAECAERLGVSLATVARHTMRRKR